MHLTAEHEPFVTDEPPEIDPQFDMVYEVMRHAQWNGFIRLEVWKKGRERIMRQLNTLKNERTALLGRAFAWADDTSAEPWTEKDAYRLQLLSYVLRLVHHLMGLTDDAVHWLSVSAWLQNEELHGMPMELMKTTCQLDTEKRFSGKLLEIAGRHLDELAELRPLVAQRDAELSLDVLKQYLPD